MAQNVRINNTDYPDVPAIEVPKTGGGTATFPDTSDATATAADILSGKTAYVDGVKVTGTIPNLPVAEDNDIIFIDYDGTIRYSYSMDEIQQLTELPPGPDHSDEGLVFQRWTWTLQKIKDWGYECEIGALYTTSSGYGYVFVYAPYDGFTVSFRCHSSENTLIVNWGDSDQDWSMTPTDYYVRVYHTFDRKGTYRITIKTNVNYFCCEDAYKAFFGNKILSFNPPENKASMAKYLVPCESTVMQAYALQNCKFLVSFSEYNRTVVPDYNYDLYNLRYVSFNPEKLIKFNSSGLPNCVSLVRATFPSLNFTSTSNFTNANSLVRFIFPDALETIQNNNFTNVYNLHEIRFLREAPPTIGGTSVLTGLPSDAIILFPYTSTDYLTATNYPSPATYAYLGFKKSTNGEVLPTTVGSYTLTWYATKADANAKTNPITTGNGSEVYARYEEVAA